MGQWSAHTHFKLRRKRKMPHFFSSHISECSSRLCLPLNQLNCPVGPSVQGWKRHQAGELNWSMEAFFAGMEGQRESVWQSESECVLRKTERNREKYANKREEKSGKEAVGGKIKHGRLKEAGGRWQTGGGSEMELVRELVKRLGCRLRLGEDWEIGLKWKQL